MNKNNTYILEVSEEEVVMLYDLIMHNNLYQSSYEPLKDLVRKINVINKEIKKSKQ